MMLFSVENKIMRHGIMEERTSPFLPPLIRLELEARQWNCTRVDSAQAKGSSSVFTQCTINLQNSLPQGGLRVTSRHDFKAGLGTYMKMRSIRGYWA